MLLKTVILAVPTYIISNFKLSNKLRKEIGSLVASFWWNSKDKNKSMHWMYWRKMTDIMMKGDLALKISEPLIHFVS